MKIKRTDIDASGQTDGYVLSVSGGKLVFSAPTGGGGSGALAGNMTGDISLSGFRLIGNGTNLVSDSTSDLTASLVRVRNLTYAGVSTGSMSIRNVPSAAGEQANIILGVGMNGSSSNAVSITMQGNTDNSTGTLTFNASTIQVNSIAAGATTNLYRLPTSAGTTGQFIKKIGGNTASWANIAFTDVSGTVTLAQVPPSATNGQVLTTVAGAVAWATPVTPAAPTFIAPRVAVVTGVTGSYNVDWSLYDTVELQLTGNVTLTFSGAVSGQKTTLKIKQDATGSRTVTLPTSVRFGTDVTSYTATTTASKKDYVGFQYDAADAKYDFLSAAKGF